MLKYKLLLIAINIIICDDDPMNYIIDNIYLGGRDAATDIEYLKQYTKYLITILLQIKLIENKK